MPLAAPPALGRSHFFAVHSDPSSSASQSQEEAVLQLPGGAEGGGMLRLVQGGVPQLSLSVAEMRQVVMGFAFGHQSSAQRPSWYPHQFSIVCEGAEPLTLGTHTDAERQEAALVLHAALDGTPLPPPPLPLRVGSVMRPRRVMGSTSLAVLFPGRLILFADASATKPLRVLRLSPGGCASEPADEEDPCLFGVRHAGGSCALIATDLEDREAWVDAIHGAAPPALVRPTMDQVRAGREGKGMER